jgi:ABC-type branched-subunit amino acid transport system ATPase component
VPKEVMQRPTCIRSISASRPDHAVVGDPQPDGFYGDFQALYGIDMSFDKGETIAIIGANGQGSRHFSKPSRPSFTAPPTACGLKNADRRASAADIVKLGIALVPEGGGCFPRLPWKRIS